MKTRFSIDSQTFQRELKTMIRRDMKENGFRDIQPFQVQQVADHLTEQLKETMDEGETIFATKQEALEFIAPEIGNGVDFFANDWRYELG